MKFNRYYHLPRTDWMTAHQFDTDILFRAVPLLGVDEVTFTPLFNRTEQDIAELKACKKFFENANLKRVYLYSVKKEWASVYHDRIVEFYQNMSEHFTSNLTLSEVISNVKGKPRMQGFCESFQNFSKGDWKQDLIRFREVFTRNQLILIKKTFPF